MGARRRKGFLCLLIAVLLLVVAAAGCGLAGKKDSGELTIQIAEGIDADAPVLDYATEQVRQSVEYHETQGVDKGYTITESEITGITPVNTGTAWNTGSYELYRLEYRLRPDKPENVALAGGVTMEDGYITEWSSRGQPYLLLCLDYSSGEAVWQPICVTDTDTIEQVYGTPKMLIQYGNAYTAAAMELGDEYWSPETKTLDVVAAMKAVTAEDFIDSEYFVNVSADALAKALNGAAEHQIDETDAISAGYLEDIYPFWQMNPYLEDGPDGQSMIDLHFEISCELTENIVEVSLTKYRKSDTAYFEDETLYWLVRQFNDYEEAVDEAAYEKFKDILVPEMEENYANMSGEMGNFTGYQLTRFVPVWSYEKQDKNAKLELYDFEYALLSDDLDSILWAGGMYLDSKLRVNGFNGGGQFAVAYLDGEIERTRFMGNDFHFSGQESEDTQWAVDELMGLF